MTLCTTMRTALLLRECSLPASGATPVGLSGQATTAAEVLLTHSTAKETEAGGVWLEFTLRFQC